MRSLREFVKGVLATLALFVCVGSLALAQTTASEPMRVVLKGHDPVAYFTNGKPVMGSAEFRHDWDGERYHFANAANRDKFAANPERYAPQFGGYCTGSMSRKIQNEADPQAWIIADGRLYVFGQVKFAEQARKDPEYLKVRIPLATVNWQEKKK